MVTEQELAPYWTQFASTKAGSRLGALEGIFLEIAYAHTPVLMALIIPPAFMTDISNGQFVGGLNDVKTGLSIFCIHPANVPNWQQLNEQNRMYTATAMGAGMAQMLTITMMLANDAIGLSDSSKEFRGYLEGYAVILLALCSEHNRVVQDYRANIMDRQSKIITYIEQMFPNPVHCHTAWAVVLMYIYCMMNDFLTRLLTAHLPQSQGHLWLGLPLWHLTSPTSWRS